MKKKKTDALLKSFNKQRMATLTQTKGNSLGYACAVFGGAAQDHATLYLTSFADKDCCKDD